MDKPSNWSAITYVRLVISETPVGIVPVSWLLLEYSMLTRHDMGADAERGDEREKGELVMLQRAMTAFPDVNPPQTSQSRQAVRNCAS